MLKYQLHKLSKGAREARAVLLEDILTSDVFGVMSYFPYDFLLKRFFQQIRVKNPRSHFLVPPIAPEEVHFWKGILWPEMLPHIGRTSIEPDVIIEWPNMLFIIEAKFVSATDPEELLRQYLVGATEASSNQQFFLLLIDKNMSPPSVAYSELPTRVTVPEYIEARIKELNLSEKFPPERVSQSCLWVNWQSFYALIEGLVAKDKPDRIAGINQVGGEILADLLLILERKGLIPFETLRLSDFDRYDIDIGALAEIGRMMKRSFSDLSDISIDISVVGGIGSIVNDSVPFLSEFRLDQEALTAHLAHTDPSN